MPCKFCGLTDHEELIEVAVLCPAFQQWTGRMNRPATDLVVSPT